MIALLLDTETTALIQNRTIKLRDQPEVIEFYGCKVDLKEDRLITELWQMIKPRKPISKEITDITGITNEDLLDKDSFAQVAPMIKSYIEKSELVIAHNMSYDKEVIDIEFERLGQEVDWPPLLCTVEQTAHLKGFRLSLTALHEYLFNQPFADAHRANIDVAALRRCCVELTKRGMI